MHSLTFYITAFVIKLKGIKNIFSHSPIDYHKLRKDDVYLPPKILFQKINYYQFKVQKTNITEIISKNNSLSNFLLLYCHGGAFISGPVKHHWNSLHYIVKNTNIKTWLINYPKAPEYQIEEILNNLNFVYHRALESYNASNIILMGDSAGATLLISFLKQLQFKKHPIKFIGISPVLDASMTNIDIDLIDKADIMLSKEGIVSAKKMCAGNLDLKNPLISPLYGNHFRFFPDSTFYLAENDICYPDALLFIEKLKLKKIHLKVIVGKGMPHIWPLLPVMKEAKIALKKIIQEINDIIN